MDYQTPIQYILLIILIGLYLLCLYRFYPLIPAVFYEKDNDTWAWSLIFTTVFLAITVGLGIHICNMNTSDKLIWNIISGSIILFCFYGYYRNKKDVTVYYVD